jgi:peptide/nickel transport system permease protein
MAAPLDDAERRSEWQALSRRFRRNRLAVIGAVVFLAVVLVAALANVLAPAAVLEIGSVILAESTLSFFGFGVQPPTPSWGNMLANAESNMAIAPWVATLPGVCIVVTVMSIFTLGDGLRDALVPDTR